MGIKKGLIIFLFVTLSNSQYLNKPWPTYSLENMPQTGFSCRDKILGGYYADPETQCQMFHVCVKVAGVGIQDFRFLCPNSTAFDQEAQICADWGDIDCEAATLYYGSDNFDLYRIGSGFDSKRAPFAEENEASYHLQRAETGDARRGIHTVVNQNTRIEKSNNFNQNLFNRSPIPNQPKTTQEPTTKRDQGTILPYHLTNRNINNYSEQTSTTQVSFKDKVSSNRQNVQKQQPNNNNQNIDEIFKESQSSHFFNNRNNGKEDFEEDIELELTSTRRPIQQIRIRGRGHIRATNVNNINPSQSHRVKAQIYSSPTHSTYNSSPIANTYISTTTVPNSGQNNYYNLNSNKPVTTTQATFKQHVAPVTTTTNIAPFFIQKPTEKFYNAYNTAIQLQQQEQRQFFENVPTTSQSPFQKKTAIAFNPDFYLTQSSTPNYSNNIKIQPTSSVHSSTHNNYKQEEKINNKPSENPFYNVHYETKPAIPVESQQQHYNEKQIQSRNYNTNEDFKKISTQNHAQQYNNNNNYNYNNNNNQFKSTRVKSTIIPKTTISAAQIEEVTVHKVFTQNQSYNNNETTQKTIKTQEKYQTVNRGNNYTPPSTAKKFSTLVPKEQYSPTTFKPNTYKKAIEGLNVYKSEKIDSTQYTAASYLPTTTSTTVPPQQRHQQQQPLQLQEIQQQPQKQFPNHVIISQQQNDEDDGQYHPELYERDFVRNKLNQKFNTQKTENTKYNDNNNNFNVYEQHQKISSTTSQSSEDEFLKTAHSQNIAASANELRVEKEKKSQQITSSPRPSKAPTIPPNSTSTKKTPKNKDASYDYAYYDSSNSRDYSEYDVIEEFDKTRKQSQ